MTDNERHRFAVPPAVGELDGIDLAFLNPDDEDDRRILILAEHPELQVAIESDRSEIHAKGTTISPALHLAMHEIVANQLWAYDPPEVWHTAQLNRPGFDGDPVIRSRARRVARGLGFSGCVDTTSVVCGA